MFGSIDDDISGVLVEKSLNSCLSTQHSLFLVSEWVFLGNLIELTPSTTITAPQAY
jgi:hypothetical protein